MIMLTTDSRDALFCVVPVLEVTRGVVCKRRVLRVEKVEGNLDAWT